ncbi:MAG: aminomethyl-transferring glycine dehydrogenase subunit GcvPA [Desulfurococcaceae archaeon]
MLRHPWIPSSSEEQVQKILETLGIKSVEELFSDIPPEARISKERWDSLEIGAGRPLSEIEVRRIFEQKLSKNSRLRCPPFMGGGVYPHYVPPLVKYIISRGEFLTAYTPYQAEASQGLMQALFEYQSLMAELLEMDVVNASMYDWASAAAEAVLMALRVNRGRRKVVLPRSMNPWHRRVVETYASPHGVKFVEAPHDERAGSLDVEALKGLVDSDTAAVYVQYPNFFGVVEPELEAVAEVAHEKGALFIAGVYPLALGLLKSPGEVGADVAVGEGQPFGLGMNYGGPHLGIFAVRNDANLVRQMPGRLIGLTTTVDGLQRAFAMVLQTREQHIRRERATSNICTNEALMAVAAAVYMSLLGWEGLRKLAELNYYRAHYAGRKLSEAGLRAPIFEGDFFNEFAASFEPLGVDYRRVHEALLGKGIHGGIYLGDLYPELGNSALMAFTELHSKEDIDYLAESIAAIARG